MQNNLFMCLRFWTNGLRKTPKINVVNTVISLPFGLPLFCLFLLNIKKHYLLRIYECMLSYIKDDKYSLALDILLFKLHDVYDFR